jgi:phosphoribosylpyrophosphate synthetase
MKKRGCIVSKLMAQMLTKAGMTHLITMDLHQKEVNTKTENKSREVRV